MSRWIPLPRGIACCAVPRTIFNGMSGVIASRRWVCTGPHRQRHDEPEDRERDNGADPGDHGHAAGKHGIKNHNRHARQGEPE